MQANNNAQGTPQTLDDIRLRKRQISKELSAARSEVVAHWHTLTTPQKANSKGELIAAVISNSITAFDAFLLVRKLTRTYRNIFGKRR